MPDPVYAADPPGALRRVDLDGLAALFHAPSGMTHVVASPASEILEALAEGPADAEAILGRMRRRYELDGDAAAVAARLAELEQAGLVWRA
jgi:PqqD family protein of HPr-rel-A system